MINALILALPNTKSFEIEYAASNCEHWVVLLQEAHHVTYFSKNSKVVKSSTLLMIMNLMLLLEQCEFDHATFCLKNSLFIVIMGILERLTQA